MRTGAQKTLDAHLCRLADAVEEHERVLDLDQLLLQLWHHHVSQAKGLVPPCSKQYNHELAKRLGWHLGFEKHRPEVKYAGNVPDVARSEARRWRDVRRGR